MHGPVSDYRALLMIMFGVLYNRLISQQTHQTLLQMDLILIFDFKRAQIVFNVRNYLPEARGNFLAFDCMWF